MSSTFMIRVYWLSLSDRSKAVQCHRTDGIGARSTDIGVNPGGWGCNDPQEFGVGAVGGRRVLKNI